MLVITVAELGESLGGMIGAFDAMTGGTYPKAITQAMNASVNLVAETWRSYLVKRQFPGGDLLKKPYSRHAQKIRTKVENGGSGKAYIEDSHSEWMEKGAKSWDMKDTHPYGKKSRMGKPDKKTGVSYPYLIVPFRHQTPGTSFNPMNDQVYSMLRGLIDKGKFMPSRVEQTQHHTEPNFKGENIWRASYKWGSRLSGLSSEFEKYEGLVHFQQKSDAGGNLNSSYMTFRIISAKPSAKSWIVPEKPAVLPHVLQATKDDIASLFQMAIREDFPV